MGRVELVGEQVWVEWSGVYRHVVQAGSLMRRTNSTMMAGWGNPDKMVSHLETAFGGDLDREMHWSCNGHHLLPFLEEQ